MPSLALSLSHPRTLMPNCFSNIFTQKSHRNLISPLKTEFIFSSFLLYGFGTLLFHSSSFVSLLSYTTTIYLCPPFPTYYKLSEEYTHSFKYLLCTRYSTRYSSWITKINVINLGIQGLVKAGRHLINNLILNTIMSHNIGSTKACYMNIANNEIV